MLSFGIKRWLIFNRCTAVLTGNPDKQHDLASSQINEEITCWCCNFNPSQNKPTNSIDVSVPTEWIYKTLSN